MTNAWQVFRIDVAPDEPTRVTFRHGTTKFCFFTSEFGAGRRGRKSAALARFIARSGLAEVEDVYDFLISFGDYAGPVPINGLDQEPGK